MVRRRKTNRLLNSVGRAETLRSYAPKKLKRFGDGARDARYSPEGRGD